MSDTRHNNVSNDSRVEITTVVVLTVRHCCLRCRHSLAPPLQVSSTTSHHQLHEGSVLGQVNCFSPRQPPERSVLGQVDCFSPCFSQRQASRAVSSGSGRLLQSTTSLQSGQFWVRSTASVHDKPPERSVLGQVNCFSPRQASRVVSSGSGPLLQSTTSLQSGQFWVRSTASVHDSLQSGP